MKTLAFRRSKQKNREGKLRDNIRSPTQKLYRKMYNMKKSPQHSNTYRDKLGVKDLHFEDQNKYSERECRI